MVNNSVIAPPTGCNKGLHLLVRVWQKLIAMSLYTDKHCSPRAHSPLKKKKEEPFKVALVGGKRYSGCTCGYSKKQVK